MSRKHNVKHDRTKGGYARRLKKRGLTRAPRMTPLDQLRRNAVRRGDPVYEEEDVA